jgi:hypothetical protein
MRIVMMEMIVKSSKEDGMRGIGSREREWG